MVGCAPAFTEFQGADLVGKGKIEVTPYFSSTSSSDEDAPSGDIQDSKGLRLAYGLSEKFDANIKYEKIDISSGMGDGSVFGLGLKYNLYSDEKHRFSVNLPIVFSTQNIDVTDPFSEGSSSMSYSYRTIEPTVLGSSKILNNIDVNYSAKMLIKIAGDGTDSDNGYAFNLSGLLFIPQNPKIGFMPEYGILKVDDSSFSHFGIGLLMKL